MDPFTHLYHTSYTGILENNPLANMETINPLQESEYYGELRYLQQRIKEELLRKDWMRQRKDLENKFQKKLEGSMKVRSSDNRVKFIYKYKGHEVLGATIFRFKIILIYHSLLRKWYLSSGYSFVPEVIDLKNKLRSGTYHPFSEEVFNIINDVRHSIDVFMTRLTTVYQFVHNAQKKYKDVQFFMNIIVTKMKLTFMENAWPSDLQKLSINDMIVIELKLDKNIQVRNIAYTYRYQKTRARDIKENLNKIKLKLQNFFNFSLEEAFEKFITREERFTQIYKKA